LRLLPEMATFTGMDPERPTLFARLTRWAPFVASAALVALGVHLAVQTPWLGVAFGVLAVLVLVPQLRARRRIRKLLVSGDLHAVLGVWEAALASMPHRETMAPLVAATALASNGLVQPARSALERAAQAPAWDVLLEHRLFVETLLDAFEGERERAIQKANRLEKLPLPSAGPFARARIAELRVALSALARAFAHAPQRGDIDLLSAASRRNPMVHWAMRYAAVVACIDAGERARARKLLAGAPAWPQRSVFHAFHEELTTHASACNAEHVA
jgi:hypothetical protein